MPSGLAIPITVTSGRTSLDVGEEQTAKIIRLMFGDGTSLLSFVRRGISPVTFRIDGPELRGVVTADVTRGFKSLERQHRAKLLDIKFGRATAEGDMPVTVRYVDLRTDRQEELLLSFGGRNA